VYNSFGELAIAIVFHKAFKMSFLHKDPFDNKVICISVDFEQFGEV
jgi:hypothetical protein